MSGYGRVHDTWNPAITWRHVDDGVGTTQETQQYVGDVMGGV